MTPLVPESIAAEIETGRKSSNLAFALCTLPADRRSDALAFYRFCRAVDDIADAPDIAPDDRRRCLDAWLSALDDPTNVNANSLPFGLTDVIARREIPTHLLREIVLGVRSDLDQTRYATYADLEQYCWRVASAVGLVSIRIFGATHPQSLPYAESLGLALQLTNILRDVGEDASLGRIYLPLEDLDHFNVPESDLLNHRHSPQFRELAHFQAARAHSAYHAATTALHAADKPALRPAEIMRRIYFQTLQKIESHDFQVLTHRFSLPKLQKIWLALTTR